MNEPTVVNNSVANQTTGSEAADTMLNIIRVLGSFNDQQRIRILRSVITYFGVEEAVQG